MHKRIRLTWERNQDTATKQYQIYRSTRGEVSRRDTLVMVVEHPATPTPIQVVGERPTRISEGTYKLRHGQIISLSVRVNGAPVAGMVDGERGVIKLTTTSTDVVEVDYTYDGIEVFDKAESQAGVTYYGPVALDRSNPTPPTKAVLRSDPITNEAIFSWQASDAPGITYDYRIEAVGERGQQSKLSLRASATLVTSLAHLPYRVERSLNRGMTWETIADTESSQYVESYVDKAVPPNVRYLQVNATANPATDGVSQGTADIAMTWTPPDADRGAYSAMYRVRTMNELGAISEPSKAVGPIQMKTGLKEIVIRRKVYDGSFPTLSGADAETVAILAPNATAYTDYGVPDNNHYAYAIYTVDLGSNYAVPVLFDVTMGDVTAPNPVVIVDVRQFEF